MVGKVSSRAVDYKWNHGDPMARSLDRQKSPRKAMDRQTVFFFTADDRTSFGFTALGVDVSAPSGHSAAARVVS